MKKHTLFAVLVSCALSVVCAQDAKVDNLGFISDELGLANAWRLIPKVLYEHCSKQSPQTAEVFDQVFRAWSQSNGDLIALINQTVDRAAPLYATELSISIPAATSLINDSTTRLIVENYLRDESLSASQVCADYPKIISGLSTPGRLATVRGHVYAVERAIARGQSR